MGDFFTDMCVSGEMAEDILNRFTLKLQGWELTMPPVAPLIIDFGLGEFYKIGLIEYWIANEIDEGYCGKYLFLFDGQQCPFHSHKQKHETFFVVKGKIKMVVNGAETIMDQGRVLIMPPGDIHSFWGIGDALILEISKPCILADNIFEDKRIADCLAKTVPACG